jgi:hypothetical protein
MINSEKNIDFPTNNVGLPLGAENARSWICVELSNFHGDVMGIELGSYGNFIDDPAPMMI